MSRVGLGDAMDLGMNWAQSNLASSLPSPTILRFDANRLPGVG